MSAITNVVRLADSNVKRLKVSDIPGSADRAKQLLDSLAANTHGQQKRFQLAAARLPTEQANVERIETIIKDLPKTASAKDRASWARELEGARNELRGAAAEMELASGVQAAAPEHVLRMQKFIAAHLDISLEQAQSMYTERLDKLA